MQSKLEDSNVKEGYSIKSQANKDNTMRQLIEILKRIGLDQNGRFLIYNLFTLRNAKMNEALKEIQDQDIDSELLYQDYEDYKRLQKHIPWTLIGWGCSSNKNINKKKKEWLNYIQKENIINIGDKHKDNPHYYHPLPQIHSKKIEYVDTITEQLKKLMPSNSV